VIAWLDSPCPGYWWAPLSFFAVAIWLLVVFALIGVDIARAGARDRAGLPYEATSPLERPILTIASLPLWPLVPVLAGPYLLIRHMFDRRYRKEAA